MQGEIVSFASQHTQEESLFAAETHLTGANSQDIKSLPETNKALPLLEKSCSNYIVSGLQEIQTNAVDKDFKASTTMIGPPPSGKGLSPNSMHEEGHLTVRTPQIEEDS